MRRQASTAARCEPVQHLGHSTCDVACEVATPTLRKESTGPGVQPGTPNTGLLRCAAAGEEAGRLDELLLSAAAYFDSLLMQRIDTLTGLINPLLTAVLGAAVAGMMVASFLPVFDMPGALQ